MFKLLKIPFASASFINLRDPSGDLGSSLQSLSLQRENPVTDTEDFTLPAIDSQFYTQFTTYDIDHEVESIVGVAKYMGCYQADAYGDEQVSIEGSPVVGTWNTNFQREAGWDNPELSSDSGFKTTGGTVHEGYCVHSDHNTFNLNV